MSLKLDMEKAYDRVEWPYLRKMMARLNMPRDWIELVMFFVESVSYSVLINGEQGGYLKPGRGLRQGYPLSPYLFLLCTEGLIASIEEAIVTKQLQGIKLNKHSKPISNIFFADDSIFFGQASVEEARCLQGQLQRYEVQSGQRINLQKSSIFFSPNVSRSVKASIIQIL